MSNKINTRRWNFIVNAVLAAESREAKAKDQAKGWMGAVSSLGGRLADECDEIAVTVTVDGYRIDGYMVVGDRFVHSEEWCEQVPVEQAIQAARDIYKHRQAKAELDTAREVLRDALRDAQWGASGCVFITRQSSWPHGNNHTKTLFVNRRRRAVLSESSGRVNVVSAQEAEEEFQTIRSNARQSAVEYQKNLEDAGRMLWEEGITSFQWDDDYCEIGGGWTFFDGQHGGYLRKGDISVSANGALARAKAIEAREGKFYNELYELEADRKYHNARW